MANQSHARLFRRASTLLVVAVKAARDNVFPGFCPSLDNGYDMVESQVLGRALFPAILAGMMVPCIDVGPAELDMLEVLSDLYIFEETEDTGHLDGEADASDFAVVFSQDLYLALVKQGKRPFPANYVYGLISCI